MTLYALLIEEEIFLASFWRCSVVEPSQTVYKHVTDVVFIKEYFTTQSDPRKDTHTPSLDYNALCYVYLIKN